MNNVQETVFDIVAAEARIERSTITRSSTLKDLAIDSLDGIQILFAIEKHFDINLPDRSPQFDTESVDGLIVAVDAALAKRVIPAAVA